MGEKLIDVKYEKIWEDAPAPCDNHENAYRVISGDFVTTDEGTGVVHTAPTFGADDALAASQANPLSHHCSQRQKWKTCSSSRFKWEIYRQSKNN